MTIENLEHKIEHAREQVRECCEAGFLLAADYWGVTAADYEEQLEKARRATMTH